MTEKLIPTASQTVGPFFRIGLQYLLDAAPASQIGGDNIEIHGQLLDCNGNPVPDAVLEFWSATDTNSDSRTKLDQGGYPSSFKRAPTDIDGRFSAVLLRPASTLLEDGQKQAPHLLVLIFMRGLLRHLLSRIYFSDEPGNAHDPVLQRVPPERRSTLIAHSDGAGSYEWKVVLQGTNETVFFAW